MGLAEFFVRVANVYSGQDLNPFNYTGKSKSPNSTNNSEGTESTKCRQACLKPEAQDSVELNNVAGDEELQPFEKADSGKTKDLENDGTYYFIRQAKLDYNLQLQFNLSALTQTVQQMSEGDVLSVDDFAAAGFGLKADMDFSGREIIQTNMIDSAQNDRTFTRTTKSQSLDYSRATAIKYQSRDFNVQSFQREALNVRQSEKITDVNGHRRTVNKFSLRYVSDDSFSYSFLERFNVQTRDVGGQAPESLSGYLQSAGNVAEKGSEEMMTSFFDIVDNYLDNAETELLENVSAFFDMATKELGFSTELVDVARDNLVNTVEGFFDRVDMAVDGLESRFVSSEAQLSMGMASTGNLIPATTQEQTQFALA